MKVVCRFSVSAGITANVFALGAVADFGAKSCQVTTKADARQNAELPTKTAIEPNACYMPPFLSKKTFFENVWKFKIKV